MEAEVLGQRRRGQAQEVEGLVYQVLCSPPS